MRVHRCKSGCECDRDEVEKDDKWVQVVGVDEEAKRMKLGSQVAAVSKPLLAVKRMVEKGNHVLFGPGSED
eukprot:7517780-Karenia_brevis.AAC.1